jgi:hypothetical protein
MDSLSGLLNIFQENALETLLFSSFPVISVRIMFMVSQKLMKTCKKRANEQGDRQN